MSTPGDVEGRHGLNRSRAEFVAPAGMRRRPTRPWSPASGADCPSSTPGPQDAGGGAHVGRPTGVHRCPAGVGRRDARRRPPGGRGDLAAPAPSPRASCKACPGRPRQGPGPGRAEDAWTSELAARAEAALAIPCDLAEADARSRPSYRIVARCGGSGGVVNH